MPSPFLRHSTLLSRYLRPIIAIKPYKFGSLSRDRKCVQGVCSVSRIDTRRDDEGREGRARGRETPRIKNSREQIHHQVNDRPVELSVIPSRFTSRRYSSTSVSLFLFVRLSGKGVAGETNGLTVRQSVVFPRVHIRVHASSRILLFSFFFHLVRRAR